MNVLESRAASRQPMITVGYGFPRLGPNGEVPETSEWDGWRRIKASRLDRVIDDTWASWTLPSQICFGDSGSPTFFNSPSFGRFDLSVVAVASDGGIDCISADYRARVDAAAVQHWIRDTIQQSLSRAAVR